MDMETSIYFEVYIYREREGDDDGGGKKNGENEDGLFVFLSFFKTNTQFISLSLILRSLYMIHF
jgi:hypothetical protein